MFCGLMIRPNPTTYSMRLVSGSEGIRIACFLEGVGLSTLEYDEVLLEWYILGYSLVLLEAVSL